MSRVAVSRYDAVAIAAMREFSGYVSVRYPEGRWAAVRKLGDSHTLVTSPDVAFDARGRLLLVWTQAKRVGTRGFAYAGPNEAMAQTWTEAKGWGSVKTLGPANNFQLAQPSLATDPRGDAIVAWRGYRRSGKRHVEAVSTSFRPAGHGWQPMQQLPGGGPYRDVTLDAKGNAYAVWTTYAGPRNYFSMRPRGTGRWGSGRRLPGLPASLPTVAANPDGAAVIAWRAAIVDSEGEGTQYGPVRAIVRSPAGRWSKVNVLSSIRVHEVRAALSPTTGTILLSWGAPPIFGPERRARADRRALLPLLSRAGAQRRSAALPRPVSGRSPTGRTATRSSCSGESPSKASTRAPRGRSASRRWCNASPPSQNRSRSSRTAATRRLRALRGAWAPWKRRWRGTRKPASGSTSRC